MTPEQIADFAARSTTPPLQPGQGPYRPADRARPSGLPAPAAQARPVHRSRPGLLGAALPGSAEENLQTADERSWPVAPTPSAARSSTTTGSLLDRERVDWLEFYIVSGAQIGKAQPPALTPRLFLLREGDRLFLGEKITGHFTLDPVKPDDTVVFLGHRHRRGAAQLHAVGAARAADTAAASCRPAACAIAAISATSPSTRS